MFKFLRTNVDKMSKPGQFIAYLSLGILLFGTLTVVSVLSGEDKRIAWASGTIALTIWTAGLIIWLGRKESKKRSKNAGTNPS